MSVLTIRQARFGEEAIIAQFQKELALETENQELDLAVVSLGVHAVLTDANKGSYWVAEKDQMILGCLLTTLEWSEWRNGVVLWVQSLYVLPQYRGQGVYKQMYRMLQMQVTQDDSLKGIRLYVERGNTEAQSVYESLGMNGDHYKLYEWMKEK